MLTEKKIKCVLSGRENNDPIERIFSLIRCLAGCFIALDTTICYQTERTSLLRLVAEACCNDNGSHSKSCFKFFSRGECTYQNFGVCFNEEISRILWKYDPIKF